MSGPRLTLRPDLARNLLFADAASEALRSRIDAHIARSGIDAPEPEPDPADEPYPWRSIPRPPLELDLRRAAVATVIWAVGFDADTGFVRRPIVGDRGEITQRDGATAVPGLFVVGQSLRSRRSGTIYGVAADAPHVADLVTRRLAAGQRRAA